MPYTEKGLYRPEGLYRRPRFEDPANDPILRARQTNFVLGLYFSGEHIDPRPALASLQEDTLGYIADAVRGFHTVFDKRRNIAKADLQEVFADGDFHESDPSPVANAAFNHSATVFCFMPELARSEHLPGGYSRRQTMAPPETTLEYLQRLREMRGVIQRIITGETPHDTNVLNHGDTGLLRTVTFFDVSAQLPMKFKANDRDIVEIMLEDITISLS